MYEFKDEAKILELDYTLECIAYVVAMANRGSELKLVQFTKDPRSNEGIKKVLRHLISKKRAQYIHIYNADCIRPIESLAISLNCPKESLKTSETEYKLLTMEAIARQTDGKVLTPLIIGQDFTLGKEVIGNKNSISLSALFRMMDHLPQEVSAELTNDLTNKVVEIYGEDACISDLISAYVKYSDRRELIMLLLNGRESSSEKRYFKIFLEREMV